MNETLHLALQLLPKETLNTLYMVFVSCFFAFLFGVPLGIFLFSTKNRFLYQTVGLMVNIGRSIPFAILMIALIPFTRFIVGTSLGTTASIVPLTLAATPLVARLIENALSHIPQGIRESVQVMGATPFERIVKVALPEALPAIVAGATLTLVNLVGYSAMAGLVGGGGLGKVAIQYGYQRFNGTLMVLTLILLLGIVEGIEGCGRVWIRKIRKKRGL